MKSPKEKSASRAFGSLRQPGPDPDLREGWGEGGKRRGEGRRERKGEERGGEGATHHGVCFTASGLSVGKDARIASIRHRGHEGGELCEHVSLCAAWAQSTAEFEIHRRPQLQM